MSERSQTILVWWAVVFAVIYGIVLWLLLDMVPPPSAKLSATQIAHWYAERHTQIGLRVEKVDAERNLIYVRGAVAGPKNGIVVVRKQG